MAAADSRFWNGLRYTGAEDGGGGSDVRPQGARISFYIAASIPQWYVTVYAD